MKSKPRKRPIYGIQAPKDFFLLGPLAAICLIWFLGIHRWWRCFFLVAFIYFAFTIISMLIGSTTWYREELGRFIANQCELGKGSKALDVGCGSGSLSIAFAKHIVEGEVWGIDLWKKGDLAGNVPERAIENVRIEGVKDIVKVRNADAREIPFPDNYFDAVGSVYVLHNIHHNKKKAVSEMIRVLKPGGTLAVAEGGILWWLKFGVLPRLPQGKILKNVRSRRCLLTRVLVAEKE